MKTDEFSLDELSKAFDERKDQTLRIVALNSCGGLPYPRNTKSNFLKKIARRIIYGNRKRYNRMLTNNN